MNLHVYCDGSYLLQYHGILNKCGAGVVIKDDEGNIVFEKGKVLDTTKANDYEIKAISYAVSLLNSLLEHNTSYKKYSNIIIYNDYSKIIKDINSGFQLSKHLMGEHHVKILLGNISILKNKYKKQVMFKYATREHTHGADVLASKSLDDYISNEDDLCDYLVRDMKIITERRTHSMLYLPDTRKSNAIKYVHSEIERLLRVLEDLS